MDDPLGNLERVGAIHRVYVAAEKRKVRKVVLGLGCFPSFTVYKVKGCFRGTEESTTTVEIATDDTESVVKLGRALRERFCQEGVGLAVNGTYYRITQ